jgi:L-rhamnose mutarotase
MGEDSETIVYLQRIDPEHREDYVDVHDEVPAAVEEAMRRGGAQRFDLFVRDDVAVCIAEVEDLDEYLETVGTDPAVQEWERRVAPYKHEGVDVDADPDEQLPMMERIWSLDDPE